MELLALTAADLLVRKLGLNAVIFSDCTAALKSLGDHGRLRYMANKQNLLLLQQSKWLTARMRHVRSHPERYSANRDEWTRHMWGNHMADRACIPDYTDFGELQDLEVLSLTTKQALGLFTHEDSLYWTDLDGNPTLSTFDNAFDEHLLTDYQNKRDDYRKLREPAEAPKWSGPLRRSIQFACECAEMKSKTEGDKARMLRILWDHFMHGGNYRKMGINDGKCKLCQQPDSAQHWISHCAHPAAVASRARTQTLVEDHLATLTEHDPKVQHFVKILAMCTYRHEEGYMHKLSMIPHGRLTEIGNAMGVGTVTEEERCCYRREALQLGIILMDGVLVDYVHKRTNGKLDGLKQLAERQLVRQLKKVASDKRAKERKQKRDKKPKVSKQTRMTDYLRLEESYEAHPCMAGAEDGRRMDAGIG